MPFLHAKTQKRNGSRLARARRAQDTSDERTPCPPTASAPAPQRPQRAGLGPTDSQRLRAHEADAPGAVAVSGVVVAHAQAASQQLRQEDGEGLQCRGPVVLEGGESGAAAAALSRQRPRRTPAPAMDAPARSCPCHPWAVGAQAAPYHGHCASSVSLTRLPRSRCAHERRSVPVPKTQAHSPHVRPGHASMQPPPGLAGTDPTSRLPCLTAFSLNFYKRHSQSQQIPFFKSPSGTQQVVTLRSSIPTLICSYRSRHGTSWGCRAGLDRFHANSRASASPPSPVVGTVRLSIHTSTADSVTLRSRDRNS